MTVNEKKVETATNFNSLKANLTNVKHTKDVKLSNILEHTQTICRLIPTNCFSVFEHFVGLALKALKV